LTIIYCSDSGSLGYSDSDAGILLRPSLILRPFVSVSLVVSVSGRVSLSLTVSSLLTVSPTFFFLSASSHPLLISQSLSPSSDPSPSSSATKFHDHQTRPRHSPLSNFLRSSWCLCWSWPCTSTIHGGARAPQILPPGDTEENSPTECNKTPLIIQLRRVIEGRDLAGGWRWRRWPHEAGLPQLSRSLSAH